jgi:DNA-binding XRE family transcriptional regulator
MDLGIFQREAASQIGADPWTIANWEKGKTKPAVRFIPRILTFLGYDPRIEPPIKHSG